MIIGDFSTEKKFSRACLQSCKKLVAQLERVKSTLATEFREMFVAHEQLLDRAIREADALAWQTGYPHLLFPALALEKAQSVANWDKHQQSLKRQIATRVVID